MLALENAPIAINMRVWAIHYLSFPAGAWKKFLHSVSLRYNFLQKKRVKITNRKVIVSKADNSDLLELQRIFPERLAVLWDNLAQENPHCLTE